MLNYTPLFHALAWLLAYALLLIWCFRHSLLNKTSSILGESIFAYASEGGAAQQLAQRLAEANSCQAIALNQLKPEALKSARALFIVASTYGEGEAPNNARLFASRFSAYFQTPELHSLKFAILALGDSQYRHYCGYAKTLWQLLRNQQAQPYFDLIEVNQEDPQALEVWRTQLCAHTEIIPDTAAVVSAPVFELQLLNRQLLNAGSQGAPLYQLDFSVDKKMTWQAGDVAVLHGANFTREYTIASVPSEQVLRLLVREKYQADGNFGWGSGYLCHSLRIAESARFSVRANPNFYAPAASVPLILIGNGTGLAGLRAHLKARPLGSENWLIFGERHPEYDQIWADEMADFCASGHLRHWDLTFSRAATLPEQPSYARCHRGYVQQVLFHEQQELKLWLARGAVIYLCGSKAGMGEDVERGLQELMGREAFELLLERDAFKRDVY